jgi:hypothetical protein
MDFNNIKSLNADRLTSLTKSNTYDYSDVLIWTKGNHTLKIRRRYTNAGGAYAAGLQRLGQLRHIPVQHQGSAGCSPASTLPTSCSARPYETFYDVVKQDNDGISAHYHFYGQDEWRLSRS